MFSHLAAYSFVCCFYFHISINIVLMRLLVTIVVLLCELWTIQIPFQLKEFCSV